MQDVTLPTPDRHSAPPCRRVLDDISANVPPAEIIRRIDDIEREVGDPVGRAFLLYARGVALNRLGLADEALGRLHAAQQAFVQAGQGAGRAQAWRAIAQVHAWRGEGREASLALLHALALSPDNGEARALALIEAGRLAMELGRAAEARDFLADGLAPSAIIPALERQRAEIVLAQACIALGDFQPARNILGPLEQAAMTARIRHLALIEGARAALRSGEEAEAEALLDRAERALPPGESFERIEYDEVAAELARRRGDADAALGALRRVIARYADDDLAGREVLARLLEAEIFTAQGRREEADRTLSAALRRAMARGLTGHADRVRARFAQDGRTQPGWLPGATLTTATEGDAGRFVGRRPLGQGGMGTVARAYDIETGTEVALKTVRLAAVYEPGRRATLMASLRAEVALASRIQHPGVGRVFGLLSGPDDAMLLVRELVEGPSLRDLISTRPPPPREALACLARLAHALQAIHAAGVAHRDLKPENIILRGGVSPVIIDFGVGTDGSGAGGGWSPLYAAPEQIAGRRAGSPADLYALGMIAFELISGARLERLTTGWRGFLRRRAMVRGHIKTLIRAGLNPEAAGVLARLLHPRPSVRPRAAEAAEAFQNGIP